MERVILHSDCNCFYASVEMLHHPELAGRPLAVGGDPEQRHGIILTANYIAKRAGVKTGTALWQARQACPGLVIVPPRMDLYFRFSELAREIYREYSDQVEPYGLDESLPNCTRSGYRFLGWYDKNGNRITDDTVAWYELATAEAYWEPDYIAPAPADLFTDVYRADWFFEAVKAASERGIFTGYPDGSFRPNASMTRAMFAQVLYRIAGQPKLPAYLPFTDVSSSDWFYDAVCWAYASGIVNGVSETSFAPDRSITREQMATMLYKYSVHMDAAEESDIGSLEGFSDAASVSGYAETPLRWAVGTGLINGMGDGRLSPAAFATRAQASAILIRLTGMIRKGIA